MTRKKTSNYKRSASNKTRKDKDIEELPDVVSSNEFDRTFKINTKYKLTPTH